MNLLLKINLSNPVILVPSIKIYKAEKYKDWGLKHIPLIEQIHVLGVNKKASAAAIRKKMGIYAISSLPKIWAYYYWCKMSKHPGMMVGYLLDQNLTI